MHFAFAELLTPVPDQLSALLIKMGFTRFLSLDEASSLFQQGDISLILPHTLSPSQKVHLETHGPSISHLGLFTDESFKAPQCPFELSLSFLRRQSWNEHIQEIYNCPSLENAPPLLSHIDHVAINLETNHLEPTQKLLEMLGFKALPPHEIQGAQTCFTCCPFVHERSNFSIVLSISHDPQSQISTFLDQHRGSGIQHVAFACPDIHQALDHLQAHDIPFISIPDVYYDHMRQKHGACNHIDHLQRHHLLSLHPERNDIKLNQTFTKELMGPLFFEFIERKNCTGFGEENIRELFKAVELNEKAA